MNEKMENKTNKKIIGIDARLYGPTGAGLGRYIQEVTDLIVSQDLSNSYVLFLSPQSIGDCQIDQSNVLKVVMPERWYTMAEQLAWPKLIKKYKLDLLHVPHFNAPIICSCPLIVTIHDLILTKFPSRRASTLPAAVYWLKNLAYRLVIKRAVRQAKKIIAISQFTKDDIMTQFKVPSQKITMIYNGFTNLTINQNKAERQADKTLLLRYNITAKYLLYVGNAYPHKNLEWLVTSFYQWWQKNQDYQLVLVGGSSFFYERLASLVKKYWLQEAPVRLTGFVPDNELAQLYQQASLYVFPSRYEGFGLPPLEAMSHGCPVLASNSSCLPEVLGEAAVYFQDNQINSFLQQLDLIVNNKEQRQKLITAGFQQIKKYSWQDCAEKTKTVYLKVLNNQ